MSFWIPLSNIVDRKTVKSRCCSKDSSRPLNRGLNTETLVVLSVIFLSFEQKRLFNLLGFDLFYFNGTSINCFPKDWTCPVVIFNLENTDHITAPIQRDGQVGERPVQRLYCMIYYTIHIVYDLHCMYISLLFYFNLR